MLIAAKCIEKLKMSRAAVTISIKYAEFAKIWKITKILSNQSQDENFGYIPFSFSLCIFPSSIIFAKI